MNIHLLITRAKSVFFDTSPLIYFIEDHPIYGATVKQFVTAFESKKIKAVSSVITLQMADALQIASALHSGADLFLTNDKQLKQLTEISVAVLDDYCCIANGMPS